MCRKSNPANLRFGNSSILTLYSKKTTIHSPIANVLIWKWAPKFSSMDQSDICPALPFIPLRIDIYEDVNIQCSSFAPFALLQYFEVLSKLPTGLNSVQHFCAFVTSLHPKIKI